MTADSFTGQPPDRDAPVKGHASTAAAELDASVPAEPLKPTPQSSPGGDKFVVAQGGREAGRFARSVERIADGTTTVAEIYRGQTSRTRGQKIRDVVKSTLVVASIATGAAFGLEQYLASRHDTRQSERDSLLGTASDALGSSQAALRASAVRTLAEVGQSSDYSVPPGGRALGRHIWVTLSGYVPEYPSFERAWLLFRDFAISARLPDDDLVSSALLHEGADWDRRIRSDGVAPADWSGGSLLYHANLTGAKGYKLDLRDAQLAQVDLRNADLTDSDCRDCGLLGADLRGSTLRSVRFNDAHLAEAKLNKSDLSFARLSDADLRKADLSGTTLTQTIFTGADLRGAILVDARFSQATLTKSDFTSATLTGATFSQTDVSEAIFRDADVSGADFSLSLGFREDLLAGSRNSRLAKRPRPMEAARDKK